MASKFETDVDRIIVNTTERMLAVMRDSIHETVSVMQKPVAKGGKMRVDTGFLRGSGVAQIGSIPSGESENPSKRAYNWDSGNLELMLSKMKLGDTFYWGWTAKYAAIRELYDGFMDTALQNWSRTVSASVEKLRKKVSR